MGGVEQQCNGRSAFMMSPLSMAVQRHSSDKKSGMARRIAWIIQLAIAATLLWAGVIKLRHPFDFLASVYQYELVSPQIGQILAVAIPWTETVVGILLASDLYTDGALICAAALFAVFSIAEASVLVRGLKISCGCFGSVASAQVNYSSFALAATLFVASVIDILLKYRTRST